MASTSAPSILARALTALDPRFLSYMLDISIDVDIAVN